MADLTPENPYRQATPADRAALRKVMRAPEVTAFVTERMETLLARMWDLAMGVVVVEEKVDRDTGDVVPRIYRMPPDRQALQWLMENGIGKVPTRVELTGEDGGPVQITPWMPVAAAIEAGLTVEAEVRELPSGTET